MPKRPGNREQEQRLRQLERVRYIIWALARETWKRLPHAYKSWLDVQDLVQEGKGHTWQNILPCWKEGKGQTLTTFVYGRLRQHYINLTYQYQAEKRCPRNIYWTDSQAAEGVSVVDEHFAVIETLEIYQRVYRLSGPVLRNLLVASVGRPPGDPAEVKPVYRFRRQGRNWKVARDEFREIRQTLKSEGLDLNVMDWLRLQKKGAEYLQV